MLKEYFATNKTIQELLIAIIIDFLSVYKLVTMSGLQSLEQVNQVFLKLYFSRDLKLVPLLTADLKSFVSRMT